MYKGPTEDGFKITVFCCSQRQAKLVPKVHKKYICRGQKLPLYLSLSGHWKRASYTTTYYRNAIQRTSTTYSPAVSMNLTDLSTILKSLRCNGSELFY